MTSNLLTNLRQLESEAVEIWPEESPQSVKLVVDTANEIVGSINHKLDLRQDFELSLVAFITEMLREEVIQTKEIG